MPVSFRRDVIDQIYQSIFQPANVQLVNYVNDQWGRLNALSGFYVFLVASDP
jgi:hypothetical protein